MKDDEDTEVLKIRSSCRQFRKKAEQNMAAAQCTHDGLPTTHSQHELTHAMT
jgi:hypothetical protein